jgi:solute carrier family 25 phosphate transporter 23/24/25/41
LFKSIDRNGDGRLGKEELRNAFKTSGLAVPSRRLDGFFNEVDLDHDGYISFDEWRYVFSFHCTSLYTHAACLVLHLAFFGQTFV